MNGEYYIYGMRLRGFSLGAQPMKGLIKWQDTLVEKRFYSFLRYNRKLSDEEIKAYDLEYIGTEKYEEIPKIF